MSESLLISLREALQCALFLALSAGYATSLPGGGRKGQWALAGGVFTALLAGFLLGYVPALGAFAPDNGTWVFIRYILEFFVFYLGFALMVSRRFEPRSMGPVLLIQLFCLGVFLFFFEARALGFFVHETGLLKEAPAGVLGMALLGMALGFAPLPFLWSRLREVPLQRVFLLPSLLVFIGAFKFAFGGLGEVEEGNILVAMQGGIQSFLQGAVAHMQNVLLISGHRFIDVPLSGLAAFLSGDRSAMTVMVVLIMTPPLYILSHLFSRPDPEVSDIAVAAERRLRIAFFRRDLILRSASAMLSFLILLVALHAVNVAMNPLSEPAPIPVREAEDRPGLLSIPLSDQIGDFSDQKLRKYLYYYGSRQVMLIAIMKPDGTIGVALDECEICKPAEWNKAAQGYAQRGDHLVCKYCMTPIAVSTVNKPGGCNPIPVPFNVEERNIIVTLDDLIRTYNEAKKLQKEGTHF